MKRSLFSPSPKISEFSGVRILSGDGGRVQVAGAPQQIMPLDSAMGLGCVKTRQRPTTIEQTFFEIAFRRSKIGERF